MEIFVVILVAVIAILLFFMFKKNSSSSSSGGASLKRAVAMHPRNVKRSYKMMSYQEALEASKQFIYNITKAVMQRFTPDSQQKLLDLGKRLVKSGVTYMHVVDVAALSAEKDKQLSHMQQQKQAQSSISARGK